MTSERMRQVVGRLSLARTVPEQRVQQGRADEVLRRAGDHEVDGQNHASGRPRRRASRTARAAGCRSRVAAMTAATIAIRANQNSGCQQSNASPAKIAPTNQCLRARKSMHRTRNRTPGVLASGPMIASWANLVKQVNAIPAANAPGTDSNTCSVQQVDRDGREHRQQQEHQPDRVQIVRVEQVRDEGARCRRGCPSRASSGRRCSRTARGRG